MEQRCSKCGNESGRGFRVTSREGTTWTFDSFECALSTLAPQCGRCSSAILGPALLRAGVAFCSEDCARGAASDAVGEALAASFAASDPPSALASVERGRLRRQEGRIGWAALWLLGVPIPILLFLYFIRGCT
jgi:hypothetical protein